MDSDQGEHNAIKSIIYGNQVKDSYGNFRAFCAAISNQDQIDKIVTYLRTNQKFQKYNRFTYAFRVYEQQAFFVTQDQDKAPKESRMIEGYNEDQTLEGSGEKLLHLLQKFNVENVLIVSAIEQFDPLNKFETTHFRIIVERAKDLLNNLYTRVVQNDQDGASSQPQIVKFQKGSVLTRTVKVPAKIPTSQIEMSQIQQQPRFARSQDKQANRPNHFYADGKPTFLIKQQKNTNADGQIKPISNQRKIKDLNAKLKNSAYSLEKLLQSLSEKDYMQMKFIAKYDQNRLVEKVLCLLMIMTNIPSKDRLANDYDFKQGLENMTVNDLDDIKTRKLNEILRGDKRLNVYTLVEVNPLISTLFAFIMLIIKRFTLIQIPNNKKVMSMEELF